MPELPEVETVRRVLKKKIIGKTIKKIDVYYKGIIESNYNDFINNIINQKFIDIDRRGKYLIFELNDYYLVSHLRMEGKFFLKDKSEPVEKHEHVIFYLDDITLRYHDTRKFGKMDLVTKDKLFTDTPLCNIGIDANSDELTVDYLKKKILRNKPIKSLLLEQDVIAGIGNIYADEILFASRINPETPGSKLNDKDLENIIINSKKILDKSIEFGGTTIRSYTSSLGVIGHNQDNLMVHKREGEECFICKSKIIKTKVGGRGTYYCPKCQKVKK